MRDLLLNQNRVHLFFIHYALLLALCVGVMLQPERAYAQLDEMQKNQVDLFYEDMIPFKPEEVKVMMEDKKAITDPETQFRLGFMYFYGINVFQDDGEAEAWLLKAARQKHVKAMVGLGKLYRLLGSSKALKWLNSASKLGDPHAKFELGLVYESGFFVFQSDKRAFKYYREAAAHDVLDAHMKMGQFYKEGIAGKQDIQKALFHYKKIKDLTKSPQVKRSVTALVGGVYRAIASQEEEPEKAFKWLLIAAEYGDMQSQLTVASSYKDGFSVEQDYSKAIEWYKRAAKSRSILAMETLGNIYTNGLGVEQDYCEAQKWFLDAAEDARGSVESAWNLCHFYMNGYCGGKPSVEQSKRWCERYQRLKK